MREVQKRVNEATNTYRPSPRGPCRPIGYEDHARPPPACASASLTAKPEEESWNEDAQCGRSNRPNSRGDRKDNHNSRFRRRLVSSSRCLGSRLRPKHRLRNLSNPGSRLKPRHRLLKPRHRLHNLSNPGSRLKPRHTLRNLSNPASRLKPRHRLCNLSNLVLRRKSRFCERLGSRRQGSRLSRRLGNRGKRVSRIRAALDAFISCRNDKQRAGEGSSK